MKTPFAALAILAVLGTPALAQDLPQPVKARQGQFNILALNLGVLGGMARGTVEYDAEAAQAAADSLVAVSTLSQGAMWPDGTDAGSIAGTRAKADIWGDMDDTLISGTAVSELDRMTKHGVSPVLANQLTAGSAILTTTVNGLAPAFVGMWGAVDMIRDPYTRAASGQLVLTGLVTADVTVARGLQTRILTNFG